MIVALTVVQDHRLRCWRYVVSIAVEIQSGPPHIMVELLGTKQLKNQQVSEQFAGRTTTRAQDT
jgi:hypothetical protein